MLGPIIMRAYLHKNVYVYRYVYATAVKNQYLVALSRKEFPSDFRFWSCRSILTLMIFHELMYKRIEQCRYSR